MYSQVPIEELNSGLGRKKVKRRNFRPYPAEKGVKVDGCVAERLRRQDQNLIFLGFPGFDPQHTHPSLIFTTYNSLEPL